LYVHGVHDSCTVVLIVVAVVVVPIVVTVVVVVVVVVVKVLYAEARKDGRIDVRKLEVLFGISMLKRLNTLNGVIDNYVHITENGGILKFRQVLHVKYPLPNGILSTSYCHLRIPLVQGLQLHTKSRVLSRTKFIFLVNKYLCLFGGNEEQ
jgi:hypothetical protein